MGCARPRRPVGDLGVTEAVSASDIAAQVRTGRISALEVVDRALAAAEASHGDLNAFTLIDTSGARHRAEAIDHLVASGRDPGPLAGVPIAIKDIIDDAGMPTTSGGSFPVQFAARSAPVVRRLGAAGAIIIGRTGLHEWAFGFTSENPWFGPVRNPWNTDESPGGSSGGSGAAVAARIVPVALGTDTGGSVRVPAALCGVLGLKVTHGRVPLTGVQPLVASLDTVGPLARTVADLTTTYLAIAGDDPADLWSQPIPIDPATRTDLQRTRIAVVAEWMDGAMTDDVRAGFDRFIELASGAGVEIVEVSEPSLRPSPALGAAIGPEILDVHDARYRAKPERYGRDVAARIEAARESTGHDIIAAEAWGSAARATMSRLRQRGVDAVVTPTVGALHKTIGRDDVLVGDQPIFHRTVLSSFTAPINRMRVPALAAPVSGTGAPGVSVQLVGAMWSEGDLLGLAAAFEREHVIEVGTPPISFEESDG